MICGTALCTRLGMSVTLFCSPDAHPLSSNTSVGSLSYSEDFESGCHDQINSSLIHSRLLLVERYLSVPGPVHRSVLRGTNYDHSLTWTPFCFVRTRMIGFFTCFLVAPGFDALLGARAVFGFHWFFAENRPRTEIPGGKAEGT